MNPLLSVVIPSFNQGRFLNECLKLPLSLRNNGLEVIVMDGGSTDETVEILADLDNSLDYWRSAPDAGQAAAINEGFSKSNGTWVAFQNSDDFYLEGGLLRALEVMESIKAYDIILGGVIFVDTGGRTFRKSLPKRISRLAMSQQNFVQNQALFVKRDYLRAVGPLREDARFCLDYEWFLRLWQHRPKVFYLYEYVGAQRFHEATKTTTMQSVHDDEFVRYSNMNFSASERRFGRIWLPAYRGYRMLEGIYAQIVRRKTDR